MVHAEPCLELRAQLEDYITTSTPWDDCNHAEISHWLREGFVRAFPDPGPVLERSIEEALEFLRSRIDHWKHRHAPDQTRQRVDDLLQLFPEELFFMPTLITHLYTEGAADAPWVHAGMEIHCRLLQKATRQVCRRYHDSIRHLPIDSTSLEDDLYSCALEEVIKSLTDSYARIWKVRTGECFLLPPTRQRGWKGTLTARVALSADARLAATLRSDSSLSLWTVPDGERIYSWNLPIPASEPAQPWASPVFSADGAHLAWSMDDRQVVLMSLSPPGDIQQFTDTNRDEFMRIFGAMAPASSATVDDMSVYDRRDRRMSLKRYSNAITDWSVSSDGEWVITGSEIDRGMPKWMQDIGFRNAIYHILKRRLIDAVRKQTHTTGMHGEGGEESESTPHSLLGVYQVDTPVDELVGQDQMHLSEEPSRGWSDSHDLQRILAVLEPVTITYKKKEISCSDLARWKSEGLTNADIGERLGIPRGTVDYLWNQCREQIQTIFGDTLF